MYYNAKVKIYDSLNYAITVSNKFIFTEKKKKCYNANKKENKKKKNKKKLIQSEKDVYRSVKRAKQRIFDIVYLNKFDYFVTFTFNPDVVDSFDAQCCLKLVQSYFKRMKARKCNKYMKYIYIAEYHKSGRIHIHALVSDCNLELVKSDVSSKVYNISSWEYGYSTAIRINTQSQIKLAFYITKYITKDTKKIFNKYYNSSKNLEREVLTNYFNCDFFSINEQEHFVPAVDNLRLKYSSQFVFE